jgi:hypothetical protein
VSARSLHALAGDPRQLASVRSIVLDDGPERGVRAYAFSTGGGLDFWVLADRSLDIGPLWYRGVPVAWQSPSGFRNPSLHDPEGDGGRGFNRSFSGFLVTCGLDHIRQPAGGHPLHGRLPYTPGRVTAYGEDWTAPEPVLFCEGDVVQSRYGGEMMRLHRRIEAPIGGRSVTIRDRVGNIGPEACEHALLYHFNLGYPAIAEGTEISSRSGQLLDPLSLPDSDSGGAVLFPSDGPEAATCLVRTPTGDGDPLELSFTYSAATLPFLQLWRDLRPHVGVVSVEPCSCGRDADGTNLPLRLLLPGEECSYRTTVGFGGTPSSIMGDGSAGGV